MNQKGSTDWELPACIFGVACCIAVLTFGVESCDGQNKVSIINAEANADAMLSPAQLSAKYHGLKK